MASVSSILPVFHPICYDVLCRSQPLLFGLQVSLLTPLTHCLSLLLQSYGAMSPGVPPAPSQAPSEPPSALGPDGVTPMTVPVPNSSLPPMSSFRGTAGAVPSSGSAGAGSGPGAPGSLTPVTSAVIPTSSPANPSLFASHHSPSGVVPTPGDTLGKALASVSRSCPVAGRPSAYPQLRCRGPILWPKSCRTALICTQL